LYGMWHNWKSGHAYNCVPFFYEDWDDFSSEILIAADEDFMRLIEKLPITKGAVPRLLDYYESTDATSLTKKIKSIAAFKKIKAPMLESHNGFVPDFNNRYFTEDIPFGLQILKDLALKHSVKTPCMDNILDWAKNIASCK
jgi:NAD/NADP octopine/nopaline dehydrogenase, alpha-helical domain.